MDKTASSSSPPSLLALPKELRLVIYELVFASQRDVTVGNRAVNDKRLIWPSQPGICRSCRLLRKETLDIYFSSTRFQLNVQRPNGAALVLPWLDRLERSSLHALNELQCASVITGSGLEEPAKQYEIGLQQPTLISASRPYAAEYLYTRGCNMLSWTPLRLKQLRERLESMPCKDSPDFNVARTLRAAIEAIWEHSGSLLVSSLCTDPASIAETGPRIASERLLIRRCGFLEIPKELRLAIYEYVFASEPAIMIGQRATHAGAGNDQSIEPALSQTCPSIRSESLPMFFSASRFTLNIQRTPCLGIVLAWLDRCAHAYPRAFPNLRHVSVIAGTGIRQPPREFTLDMHCNTLDSVTMRMLVQAYRLSPIAWSPPPWDELNDLLRRLQRKGGEGYNVVSNLTDILLLLSRHPD